MCASWPLREADFEEGQSRCRRSVGALTVIKARCVKGLNHCARDGEKGMRD